MDVTQKVEGSKQEGKQKTEVVPTLEPELKSEGLKQECKHASPYVDPHIDSDDDTWEELSESSGCSLRDASMQETQDNNRKMSITAVEAFVDQLFELLKQFVFQLSELLQHLLTNCLNY